MSEIQRTPVDSSLLFQGRPGDPRLGEWAVVVPAGPMAFPAPPKRGTLVALLGCPDDLGVRRNRGRAGARRGPEAIRRHFYKMTPPMDVPWEEKLLLADAGDVAVAGEDIVETHRRARAMAAAMAATGATVILLGGGHDFAAPGFLGFIDGASGSARKKTRVALLNVDPHLDMRPLEEGLPHSGTPFRQILDAGTIKGAAHSTFGARSNRNSREAFAYAKKQRTTVITLESLRASASPAISLFQRELARLGKTADAVGVTIDMDSCSEAEGTSAAPVLGFSASELVQFGAAAGRMKKVRYLELAEVAPVLDATERSARIAAEILYAFLRGRAEK